MYFIYGSLMLYVLPSFKYVSFLSTVCPGPLLDYCFDNSFKKSVFSLSYVLVVVVGGVGGGFLGCLFISFLLF